MTWDPPVLLVVGALLVGMYWVARDLLVWRKRRRAWARESAEIQRILLTGIADLCRQRRAADDPADEEARRGPG